MNKEFESLLCCPLIPSPSTPPSFDNEWTTYTLSGNNNFNMKNTSSSFKTTTTTTTSPNSPINTQPTPISVTQCSDPIEDLIAIDTKVTEHNKQDIRRNKNKLYQKKYNNNLRQKRESQQERLILLRDENIKLAAKLELATQQTGPCVKELQVSIQSLHHKIDKLLLRNHAQNYYHI